MESTRLPGKPLKIINNKPLIYWTWKNCSKAISATKIFVATDSKKILKVCNQYGIQSIITSSNCLTGTDRVAEAISKFSNKIIINIQGDEPYINYMDIKKFISFSIKNKNSVTNAYTNLFNKKLFENKNIPKVILKKIMIFCICQGRRYLGLKKKFLKQINKFACMDFQKKY